MDKVTLLPCPFCGNPEVAIVGDSQIQHVDDCECYSMMPESWAVNCSAAGTSSKPGKGCGATSGFRESKREVERIWNQRISRPVMNSPADEAEARDRANTAPQQADPAVLCRDETGVSSGSEARPVTATEQLHSATHNSEGK